MAVIEGELKTLVLRLHEINAIKFGSFVMKSGKSTPIYLDLRVIVSYPEVMEKVADLMVDASKHIEADHVCGVPYTALPIATLMSVKQRKPMIIRRKEVKSYGTGNILEGTFTAGQTCVIVEDVITSGSSVLETKAVLEAAGLRTNNCVVLVDRCQGGRSTLEKAGVAVVSLLSLTQVVSTLLSEGRVGQELADQVAAYLNNSEVPAPTCSPRLTTSYEQRATDASPASARILTLMSRKATNLCVAADLEHADDVLTLARQIGGEICILKLHLDVLEGVTSVFRETLGTIAKDMDFLVMEDRKFADIGHVSALQFSRGALGLADLVTAHAIAGPGLVDALSRAAGDQPMGCFLVVEMSSEGNLCSPQYQAAALAMMSQHPLVTGFVAQQPLCPDTPGLLQLTPGVSHLGGGDGLGQSYASAESAVARGADIIVVGRGVTQAGDRLAAAKSYRQSAWEAYKDRLA